MKIATIILLILVAIATLWILGETKDRESSSEDRFEINSDAFHGF